VHVVTPRFPRLFPSMLPGCDKETFICYAHVKSDVHDQSWWIVDPMCKHGNHAWMETTSTSRGFDNNVQSFVIICCDIETLVHCSTQEFKNVVGSLVNMLQISIHQRKPISFIVEERSWPMFGVMSTKYLWCPEMWSLIDTLVFTNDLLTHLDVPLNLLVDGMPWNDGLPCLSLERNWSTSYSLPSKQRPLNPGVPDPRHRFTDLEILTHIMTTCHKDRITHVLYTDAEDRRWWQVISR